MRAGKLGTPPTGQSNATNAATVPVAARPPTAGVSGKRFGPAPGADRGQPVTVTVETVPNENEAKEDESGSKYPQWVKENLLLMLTIVAVFVGLGFGTFLRTLELHEDTVELISVPGQILTRLLKMLILPLIISSLISGLSQQNASTSSKMGMLALMYYSATTVLAATLGIILVLSIHPGNPERVPEAKGEGLSSPSVSTRDSVLDLIRNLFPENLVQSCFEQQRTVYKTRKPATEVTTTQKPLQQPSFSKSFTVTEVNISAATDISTTMPPETEIPKKRATEYTSGTNVLGLIGFCICFGICISSMGNARAHVIIEFFFELNEAVMKLISIIMWYSPVGIMFLISSNLASIKNPGDLMSQLGMYMITVITGLFVHGYLSLPFLYFLFTRKNPYKLVRGVLQAVITALGTSSSAATLPVTFRCLETVGIDSRVCRFVLPIGATVNMDGTALYEAVAPIFIAQMRNRDLTLYQVVVVSFTATLASIGAAAIPSAGLVTMVIVLTSIDLPTEDIYLIWAVDWLLDRFRTSINVLGDCYGTAIVAHLSEADLQRQDIEFAQRTEKEAQDSLRQIQRELSNVSDNRAASAIPQLRKPNAGMLYRRTSFIRDYNRSIPVKTAPTLVGAEPGPDSRTSSTSSKAGKPPAGDIKPSAPSNKPERV